jgi:phage tail protein X
MTLQETPTSADLDALDEFSYPPGPTKYVFFTLKPGAASLAFLGATSADILSNVVPAVGAPIIYASSVQLGLQAGVGHQDMIDALCLKDYDDSYTNNGPNEKLWFSLKNGSPTLTSALPHYTGGDILAPVGAGVRPVLATDGQGIPIDHTRLGLAATDDLDALKCAQIGAEVDKAVTDIGFDTAAGYPGDGPPLPEHPTKHLPYVAVTTSEEKVISVTSVDVNVSSTEVDDALAAFYADIPLGCQGRWYDQGNGGPWFTHDTYSVGGDPDATPFSTAQLGQEDTQPLVKKPGDSDPAYPNNTYEVDLHFQTFDYDPEYVEDAGSTVFITRFFDLQCPTPGQYHFWFCNKIEPKDYIDPILTNNVWCEEMVVESTGAAVGGIAELPEVAGGAGDQAAAPDNGSGWSAVNYAALAGGLAAAVVVLSAGAWYARRRFSRS